MDIKATKLALVQNILDTQEEAILEQIKSIFDSSTQDWWDIISDQNKNAIEEGIAQLDRGEGIPDEEVSNRIKQQFESR
ncbi:MAG: hypothetical protein WD824_01135 [Cyclobacteriaceae bacterium]